MAHSRHRHDAYGAPVPELADVREQVLWDSVRNTEQRRLLHQALDTLLRLYLRRGKHVELRLRCIVGDGVIQDQMWSETIERLGPQPGWRQPGEGR